MDPQSLQLVLGFGMPQGFEWIVIMLALTLMFGKRLPDVLRGLGGSVREFKKGMEDGPAKPVAPIAPLGESAAMAGGGEAEPRPLTPPTGVEPVTQETKAGATAHPNRQALKLDDGGDVQKGFGEGAMGIVSPVPPPAPPVNPPISHKSPSQN